MKRAFTLVELLVVLGIMVLGWLWVPSLFQSSGAPPSSQFHTHLRLLNARARMEALVRQHPVSFAIRSDSRQMAVIAQPPGDPLQLAQAPIPAGVVFDVARSSVAGNPGIFAPLSTDGGLWRAWAYNAQGQPVQTGATLIFQINGADHTTHISDEGALLEP